MVASFHNLDWCVLWPSLITVIISVIRTVIIPFVCLMTEASGPMTDKQAPWRPWDKPLRSTASPQSRSEQTWTKALYLLSCLPQCPAFHSEERTALHPPLICPKDNRQRSAKPATGTAFLTKTNTHTSLTIKFFIWVHVHLICSSLHQSYTECKSFSPSRNVNGNKSCLQYINMASKQVS